MNHDDNRALAVSYHHHNCTPPALVDEDVRWLIEDSRKGPEAVRRAEADMPEPLSQHMPADRTNPVLVTDPFWALELPVDEGTLSIKDKHLGGYVLMEVEGLGQADEQLLDLVAKNKGEVHRGRWTAIDTGAVANWPTRDELLAAGEVASTNLLAYHRRALRKSKGRPSADGWVAVTFVEEGPQRGDRRRGWLLMNVRLHRDGTRQVLAASRVMALTKAERDRRIPELAGLRAARVLVVGAGSVGAPLALELVKAGVGTVDIADYDVYDVNNAVRHVLEIESAGTHKTVALEIEAGHLNPFVTVNAQQLHVGETRKDSRRLDQLITTADVVVDATGSHVVARILARRCKSAQIPMVLAALTAGSYGAEVATFKPDGACFWCFVLAQEDGTTPKPHKARAVTPRPSAAARRRSPARASTPPLSPPRPPAPSFRPPTAAVIPPPNRTTSS